MGKFYREEYAFVPRSFVLPYEEDECKREMGRAPGRTWILKPSSGLQGAGISLVNDFSEVEEIAKQGEYVCQTYVDRPFLINKKKFDLRLYLVIYGTENMTAYLCEEGMARFCTANYEAPTRENKKNDFMHLTNYSLNKQNQEFVTNDLQDPSLASKRKLTEVLRRIQAESPNGPEIVTKIRSEIISVCKKTVAAIHAEVGKFKFSFHKIYKSFHSTQFGLRIKSRKLPLSDCRS